MLSYWMVRGDEYGLAMLALAARLTLLGTASEDDKYSICLRFLNAAAYFLRSDPDFAPEAEILVDLFCRRVETTRGGRELAASLRSGWTLIFRPIPANAWKSRGLRPCDVARLKMDFEPLSAQHPFHPVLWRKQRRVLHKNRP